MHALLLAALGVAARRPQPGVAFQTGAVCDIATANASNVPDMIRGAHLVVNELTWQPFAYRDNSTASGWGGMNLDVLEQICALLGCTYEIRDIGLLRGAQTWTDVLTNQVEQADITGSFWYYDSTRLQVAQSLYPHYDCAQVLIARTQTSRADGQQSVTLDRALKSFVSFLQPFQYELWVVIICMVFLSGVVDFLVERRRVNHTIRLTASLYEYWAGILWGGFEYPLSRTSAVYQICLGFVTLVLISSYTANLAAFITVAARSSNSVTSMNDAITNQKAICRPGDGSAWSPKITTNYPRARWSHLYDLPEAAAQRLAHPALYSDSCEGAFMMNTEFLALRANATYCRLRLAEVVFPGQGGWFTNRQSPCVQMSVSYALSTLDTSGALENITRTWMPQAQCASTTTPSAGRRLEQEAEASDPHGRRLPASAGGAAGGGAAASEGGEEATTVPRMGIMDFLGLFIVWGIISVSMVLWAALPKRLHHAAEQKFLKTNLIESVLSAPSSAPSAEMDVSSAGDTNGVTRIVAENVEVSDGSIEVSPAAVRLIDSPPKRSLNLDNEGAMLREVLKDLEILRRGQQRIHLDLQKGISASEVYERPVFGADEKGPSPVRRRSTDKGRVRRNGSSVPTIPTILKPSPEPAKQGMGMGDSSPESQRSYGEWA